MTGGMVPHETAAISVHSAYTIQPCHFMQSHILKVHTCLAVTCHLHFWQNDWNLLCATVVTQGWNKYQNKSQHRKLTQEKKILPPLLQGLEPMTFWSWIWHSNHWTIPNHNFKWQWDFWTSGENGTSGHQDIKWWWDFWTLGQQVTKELLDTRWQWDFHTSECQWEFYIKWYWDF